MEKTLQLILEQLRQLNSRVGNLEDHLHVLKEEMNSSFEKVNTKLDGITEQVVQNTETLAFVKEQTATNTEMLQATKTIMTEFQIIEQQQEQTIDLLSRRSIDLEAKLRNLNQ